MTERETLLDEMGIKTTARVVVIGGHLDQRGRVTFGDHGIEDVSGLGPLSVQRTEQVTGQAWQGHPRSV